VSTTTGETTFDENGNLVTFEQDDPRAAGLTLVIEVNRIDDNGFVSLSIAPTVTAPSGEQENPDGSVTTLLSSRSLESGLIRLRDGQTLVLTGIIQDSDRTTVSKVPILGDIPILGALFRQSERSNERREVVVLLTPQIISDADSSTWGYSSRSLRNR
jgi:type IV pilus assembly protein PilQ